MSSGSPRYPAWVPYVAPYVLFGVLTELGARVPGFLPASYPLKTVLVAGAVIYFWRKGGYPELELRPSLLGLVVGAAGFALWVLPEGPLAALPKLGESSFDPRGAGEALVLPLLAVRIAGAVLVVPVFEELFLRSFLLRFLDAIREDRDDFREIPLGRYRFFSLLGVAVFMAITHHRWLRGGLYSILVTLLLYREKRLGPVIWAHAVTNLLLAAWVVGTGAWHFW